MGWCSATQIFDAIAMALLDDGPKDRRAILRAVAETLEDNDWDCQSDSDWWDHPDVRAVFKEMHPSWFEDEEA